MATWLTAEQAWKHLRTSKSTFYRLIRAGIITPYKFPGLDYPRFSMEELDAKFEPVKEESRRE